jgi:thiol-disulfide isomerase/thioredoxin
LVLAVVGLATASTACGGDDVRELPALAVPGLAGGDELDIGALTGPAVLNLWATWCVPCTEELPDFQRASEQFPDVRFIGIDATGFGEDADSRSFLADLGVTYEQYVDTDGTFATEVEVTELPATLVLDGDGAVVFFEQGRVSLDELVTQLARLDD